MLATASASPTKMMQAQQSTLTHGSFPKWSKQITKDIQFHYGTPGYSLADSNSIPEIYPHPGKEPDQDEIIYNLKTGKPLTTRYRREPPLDDEESSLGSETSATERRRRERQIKTTPMEDQLLWDLTEEARKAFHRDITQYEKKVDKHEKEWAQQNKDDTNLTSHILGTLSSATIAQCELHPDWKAKVLKPRRSGTPCTLTHDVWTILKSLYSQGSVAGIAENLKAVHDYTLDNTRSLYQTIEDIEAITDEAFGPLDPAINWNQSYSCHTRGSCYQARTTPKIGQ